MFKQNRNLIRASAIAAAIAGTSAFANAKPSQEVIEARQETQIWTTYALSPYLRAYDNATGKVLWKARLPIQSSATPMTYVSPKTGKQYVVVTAGGASMNPARGDYVVAYALP